MTGPATSGPGPGPGTDPARLVLLTGASGYVGGRLLGALLRAGRPVRCLVRRPEEFGRRFGPGPEVVGGDLLDPETLPAALAGVDVAYYLVHSMAGGGDWAERDRRAAQAFAEAARAAGVRRVIYLGGLVREHGALSEHLRSRVEVGELLRASGVPTVELRASIILGSGSLSFELIRSLVQKLPVMVVPRWVRSLAQPIAIEDVVACLLAAVDAPLDGNAVLDLGGADRVSYLDLMRAYARQRGLRRLFVPVPVLTPRLSSLWLGLVTPVYARIGRCLIDSVRHATVAADDRAERLLGVRPRGHVEAIARALASEDAEFGATRWSDARSSTRQPRWGGRRFGTRLVDVRSVLLPVTPARAFAPVQRLGGAAGWPSGRPLWVLRGLLDELVGGPGLRRGRRDPVALVVGEALDFWRVEDVQPDRLLRLRAEMRLPGRAWLQFEVTREAGGTRLTQTALFDPLGLGGLLYWYGVYPLHALVFRGLLIRLAQAARRGAVDGP